MNCVLHNFAAEKAVNKVALLSIWVSKLYTTVRQLNNELYNQLVIYQAGNVEIKIDV